ncbi:MAG: histidine--tRNA ligase [Zunongwangia sp.]|jgi:histidyl-tRNA synthetase|uniref:Histidine--tRNA ligase n=2 Tax=Zunongwangia profunda TaxID=398743 RepID=D5BAT7_ZUNPS|nr:histidine--tRNA ligase [Zunongwangia profunda]MAC64220.1 histidine--tRNA ligase [Flavobacteriaceae bacterium]MAO37288.1 histidine--tRNA ligase [Zunongwangia sp.]ADF52450.1 histidyl-tRNA synthetase [Zunongwangia profunda SM-A87]MAS72146.1 histidine--tRNA ligase [Zunongwangia sp.]HAJ81927.1 histidine--tRNA ligase [Zunongwangia profunda]|tara:strand:- start:62 stop:1432 length:1371 start_codon:yes stop_codon:yes gene_type:complete
MAQKPSIPKGTRDFTPQEVAKRNYIFDSIKTEFKKFGFQAIETPSFENSDTLMGKYGEEGDRLIFKILNSGDFLKKADEKAYADKDSLKLTPSISEKALRYDLTVPFARYVVQHQNEIDFPFKRYQIQPVWRADRPQKGRFREFYQCDADVVGSDSLWQEVEFVQLYDSVFSALNLNGVTIKINNRKILSGFAEVIGEQDKLIDFTVALDKLDKIGEDGVVKEMLSKGISEEAIAKIKPIFDLKGDFAEKIEALKAILSTSEVGLKGIEELEFIQNAILEMPLKTANLDLDVTLARGLNYYTGAIFEVAAPDEVKMGSIGGGGRYDDLTGIFGLKNMSGVGISFGLDRIYLVLEELNLFPEAVADDVKVLFVNFGEKEALYAFKGVNAIRAEGVNAEVFPDAAKMKKQMNYANKRNIPFVILAGDEEMKAGEYTLKNMKTGEQDRLTLKELVAKIA